MLREAVIPANVNTPRRNLGTGSSYEWRYAGATPYEILGVPVNSSQAEIRAAWRKLTQVAHPDRGGTPALFVLTQDAYELLVDPVRRSDFDRHFMASNSSAGASNETSTTTNEGAPREETGPRTYKPRSTEAGRADQSSKQSKPKRHLLPWLFVVGANMVVAGHYHAIVQANESGLNRPSHGSFVIVKPWHSSVAVLTCLRADLWIPYASMLFVVAVILLYLTKDSKCTPSWLRKRYSTVRRAAFWIGVALCLPLLIVILLWAISIAVTLALIALAIALAICLLAIV